MLNKKKNDFLSSHNRCIVQKTKRQITQGNTLYFTEQTNLLHLIPIMYTNLKPPLK